MKKQIQLRLGILTGLWICALTFGVMAQNNTDNVESTRATLEKWVQTRKIISQEKRDFALSKEMLNQRIELVQREIDSLQDKIKETEQSITEADKKREDLLTENELLRQSSQSLHDKVGYFETSVKVLLKRLPEPLLQRIEPLTQRIPQKADDTQLSLSERFQNIIGILNEVDKFNREITATSEVRTLPDGTAAEVTALYVGISHGYYTNAKGDIAGVGTAGKDGWIWEPVNEAAPAISQAIAILKNEAVAEYVQLPITIE
jgi:FtsZ-binding cell division protein ZapB